MLLEPADYATLAHRTAALDYMTNEAVSLFTVTELRSWPEIALQRFRKHLYKKACKDQQHSAPHERSEEGYCYTSIEYVEQIGKVIVVLHDKGKNVRNDSLEYVFPRLAGGEPAAAISATFREYFTTPGSGPTASTRITREQDGRSTVVTTIQPNSVAQQTRAWSLQQAQQLSEQTPL